MAATMMMMSGIGKNNISSLFSISIVNNPQNGSSCSSGRQRFPPVSHHHVRSHSLGSSSDSVFYGERLPVINPIHKRVNSFPSSPVINSQMKVGLLKKSPPWWEKGHHSNMKEVKDAQDLVDSLLNAGDNLVVVDFFSPGCGGCKALHPKICRLAEMNPDVQFMLVNYEEHKSMCYSLSVHVLPFFRFYRGAEGRLCSFSCTNSTIKKFKDALAKHSPDRCSLGPVKGLDEADLIALSANRDLSFSYTPSPAKQVPAISERQQEEEESNTNIHTTPNKQYHHDHHHQEEEKSSSLIPSGR
ncbi:thioredoxin-like 1-2, chloroplastic [Impatiens glandulifera]|uniref:thioredoxin-like 1-2, chloroplastic n=1 Tax=Impatiens glandulifera TaxID=253017 RepID=UPI001FB1799C|nr:thioredoxin-like 1-2, chloroplastic [Impatiens glandulifera]